MGNSSSTKKNQSTCPFINNETSPPLSKANDEIKLIWTPDIKPLKLRNYQTGEIAEVTGPITNKYNDCRQHVCTSTYMPLTTHPHQTQIKTENSINEFESLDENYVKKEAHNFLSIYHNDMKTSENDYEKRLKQVNLEIEKTGTYIHKTDELEYGCQLAWRNSSRCINRLYWRTFKAIDHRNIRTNDEMFKAICDHIHFAYNGGTLQASVLIMNPKSRVWSSQYFRYACYEQSDGSLLGDPANLELTKIAIQVGWNKIEEKRTQWDLLPIIVQVEPNEDPSWYELPDDLQFQVFLSHPDKKYDTAIKSLGLRWFAQPYVSEKAIEVGGIFYRCVPFSGWFMETEIGRNLCDIQRYNFIPKLADLLDMDITAAANSQLNIDRLYVEINASILYSFEKAKIAIVDHHTAATGFMKFMKAEIKQRGNTPCDWVWIVPPISSGMSSVFHQEMLNYVVKPRVVDQNEPWLNYTPMKKHKDLLGIPLNKRIRHRWLILRAARVIIGFALVAVKQRISVNVLYASSSGTAYSYAQQMYKQLLYIGYNPLLNELDSFKFLQHNNERSINLIITSTFGQGNASDGGIKLEEWLKNPEKTFGKNSNEDKLISTMRSPLMWCTYAVCAIGSSAYPFYCGFGKLIDDTFEKLGGTRLIPFTMCDALNQQFKSYNQWETIAIHTLRSIYPHACLRPEILSTSSINTNISPGQEVNLNNSFRSDYNSLEFYPEKIKIQQNQSEEKGVFTKDKPYIATVIQNIELIENEDKSSNIDNEHSVRLIVFDTCGLSYLPGDHVCILPENSLTNINNLLLACDWKIDDERLDQHCSLSSFTNNKYNTIREILTYYIDLNITPKPHVLNTISIYAKDENEQRNILELGKGTQRYGDWEINSPTIIEMLEQFPSLKIPIEDIIQILPKLQPRYYSISSSTRYNPNQLHITVSIVTYRTIRDIIRNGICSNFLKQTKPLLKDDEKMIDSLTLSKENASKVQLFIVPNLHFRLPGQENLLKEINNDKELFLPLNRPLLMFAIGSGIAPFRSFWQELQILHSLNSNNNIVIDRVLFFGCRTKNDFLFAKELQLLNNEKNSSNKLLTFIIPVYSREKSAAKRYVQDAMLDYQQLISSIIKNENSFIYMCGSTRACQSIESTLASILEISNNDTLTSDQANYQIQQFKQSGKIKQDMFG